MTRKTNPATSTPTAPTVPASPATRVAGLKDTLAIAPADFDRMYLDGGPTHGGTWVLRDFRRGIARMILDLSGPVRFAKSEDLVNWARTLLERHAPDSQLLDFAVKNLHGEQLTRLMKQYAALAAGDRANFPFFGQNKAQSDVALWFAPLPITNGEKAAKPAKPAKPETVAPSES